MALIYHELFIGAPVELVYNGLTTQQGLAAWWTPDTKSKPEKESISRFSFGKEYFKEMKIIELIPNEEVKWSCVSGVDEWLGTSVSFKLQSGSIESLSNSHPEIHDQMSQTTSQNSGTILSLQHDHWKSPTSMFAECNYTWGQFLRSLKLYCETGKGTPWPNQHNSN